jgi:hypothetical protein
MPTYFGSDMTAGVVDYACNSDYVLIAQSTNDCVLSRRLQSEDDVLFSVDGGSRLLSAVVCDVDALLAVPNAQAYGSHCADKSAGQSCPVFCN